MKINKTERLKSMYVALKAGYVVNCNGCTIRILYSEKEGRNYIYWV